MSWRHCFMKITFRKKLTMIKTCLVFPVLSFLSTFSPFLCLPSHLKYLSNDYPFTGGLSIPHSTELLSSHVQTTSTTYIVHFHCKYLWLLYIADSISRAFEACDRFGRMVLFFKTPLPTLPPFVNLMYTCYISTLLVLPLISPSAQPCLQRTSSM